MECGPWRRKAQQRLECWPAYLESHRCHHDRTDVAVRFSTESLGSMDVKLD